MTASSRPRRWQAPGGWFLFVLALALLGRWQAEGARPDRCSLDGNRIIPIYRVDLMVDGRVERSFCCVKCAREWPEAPEGAYWQVRDEITGQLLDAAAACYIESRIVTVPSRQDRTHIFKGWADAENHAAEYGGTRIGNPLSGKTSGDHGSRESPVPSARPPPPPSLDKEPGDLEKSP